MRRVCEPALAVTFASRLVTGLLSGERPEQDGYRRWGVHPQVWAGPLASRGARAKGIAFSGYFSLSVFSRPAGLIAAYMVHDGNRPAVG
jgi:hypothetical protein